MHYSISGQKFQLILINVKPKAECNVLLTFHLQKPFFQYVLLYCNFLCCVDFTLHIGQESSIRKCKCQDVVYEHIWVIKSHYNKTNKMFSVDVLFTDWVVGFALSHTPFQRLGHVGKLAYEPRSHVLYIRYICADQTVVCGPCTRMIWSVQGQVICLYRQLSSYNTFLG